MCLFSFYFLSGCLNAVDDAGELLVLLLLLPQPFDAARIATAAMKENEEKKFVSVDYKATFHVRRMRGKGGEWKGKN